MANNSGRKSRRFIQDARRAAARSVREVQVGYFEDQRYDNGVPVAVRASSWDMGSPRSRPPIPETAFMRKGAAASKRDVVSMLRERINHRTLEVNRAAALAAGGVMARSISRSVVEHDLVDTGVLRDSPEARVTA